jgi:hypothetical protein
VPPLPVAAFIEMRSQVLSTALSLPVATCRTSS